MGDLLKELRCYYPRIGEVHREQEAEECSVDRGDLQLIRSDRRPALFDYQKELAKKIVSQVREGQPGLVALPTGAGKTRTAVFALLRLADEDAIRRVVWLAPSRELLDQARETLAAMWTEFGSAPNMRISYSMPENEFEGLTVSIVTPQKVFARAESRRLFGSWDLVIFDEAHQLGARTFKEAVGRLQVPSPGRARLVGLSATPGRVRPDETESLVELFEGNLLTSNVLRPNPIKILQRRGVLSRLVFHVVKEADMPSQMLRRVLPVIKLAKKLAEQDERVLVFSFSIESAEAAVAALCSQGVSARAISNRTPSSVRRRTLDHFASGGIRVLANQRLLATGYDCPSVSHVVLETRISSPILFEQMVGRVARGPRTGGSRKGHVWQFDDHLRLHGLPSSYYRFREYEWS